MIEVRYLTWIIMEIIDNKNKKLSDVINNIMPSTKNLYFRTGYFFFSGYKEIYKNLGNKNLKILVGKEAARDVNGIIQELNYRSLAEKSKSKVKKEYYDSLVKNFGDANQIDNKDTAEAYLVFKEKILNGTLEIRKTIEPDHSKVYVFENDDKFSQKGEFPGSVIKGSSNLTLSGLSLQDEDNEYHKDGERFLHYKQKFINLWKNGSVPLVDGESFPEFETEVLKKTWLEHLPKPYHIFLRVLNEYFALNEDKSIKVPAKITKDKINLKYQTDAVIQALDIISKHSGVIIADVVGLGKSIIASCVARNLKMKSIIISPRHLVEQWEDYAFEFGFNAKIYGSGSVEKALKDHEGEGERLIIVDEAHKFRNEEKSLYGNLHRLCKGNKVILLTATPFNNDPKDIFALIKLFQIPAKSTLQTVDNLSLRFKELTTEYKQIKKHKKVASASTKSIKKEIDSLALRIKDLIGPLLIRRSRLDLLNIEVYKKDLELQGIKFPRVNPPVPLEYEFGDLEDLYVETLDMIVPENMATGLRCARYNITSYLKNEKQIEKIAKNLNTDANLLRNSQENLAKFMKRLLVHRFESSVVAFQKTLDNMIESHKRIEKWLKKGQVPIYKKGDLPDVDDFYDDSDGDETLEKINDIFDKYQEKGLELIKVNDLRNDFIEDLKSDIDLLLKIRKLWASFDPTEDPKIHRIRSEISRCLNENPKRKIVVFSIYSDTAEYLFKQLKNDFRVFKYSAKDSSTQNKKTISENFDAGVRNQKNDHDVLIATDAISEGFNLHRAGIVFNYDIPYNPTRIIQRVGRINRINKKVFDELFIYNFFPSPTGEEETGIKRVTTLKIDVIKALLGDDTQYLTVNEIIKSYNNKFEDEINALEELSWDTEYRNMISSLQKSEDLEKAQAIPLRTKIRRSGQKNQKGVLVFGCKGSNYAFRFGLSEKELRPITTPEAIKLFEASNKEKAREVSKEFYPIYELLKKNLFIKKTEVPKDKGLRQAIEKVQYLKNKYPKYNNYFSDLEYVMKDLGDLPAKYAKSIRAISKENLEQDIKKLIIEVPPEYLEKIIEKADSIGEGPEALILAEEF